MLREVGGALVALESPGLLGDTLLPEDIRVTSGGRVRVDIALGLATAQYQGAGVMGARDVRYLSPECHHARLPSYCSTQYDADFANPLSALAFRRKSVSYFINPPRAELP